MDGVLALSGTGELDFHSFATLAARFIVEEDPNKLRDELRQAFLFFDREGECLSLSLIL